MKRERIGTGKLPDEEIADIQHQERICQVILKKTTNAEERKVCTQHFRPGEVTRNHGQTTADHF